MKKLILFTLCLAIVVGFPSLVDAKTTEDKAKVEVSDYANYAEINNADVALFLEIHVYNNVNHVTGLVSAEATLVGTDSMADIGTRGSPDLPVNFSQINNDTKRIRIPIDYYWVHRLSASL